MSAKIAEMGGWATNDLKMSQSIHTLIVRGFCKNSRLKHLPLNQFFTMERYPQVRGGGELYSIQIGPFVLNGQLVLYLSFGTAGWLILQYRLRKLPDRNMVLSYISNTFWLWLIVWKGSYLVFHLTEFIQRPSALLYFDGGGSGKWIASLVATAYLWRKALKHQLSRKIWIDILVTYFFAGWIVYQSLLFAFGETPAWLYAASAGLTAVLLVFLIFSTEGFDALKGPSFALWFLVGHVLFWFFVPNRTLWFLSLNKQQTLFLLTAACLTGWTWYSEKIKTTE